MQDICTFLKNNYNHYKYLSFKRVNPYFESPTGYVGNPCFFISNETVEKKRHLTLTKSNTWYDYTAKKEYTNFKDWVGFDFNETSTTIRFGYNRFDGKNSHISLEDLLKFLKYQPKDTQVDLLTVFMQRLTTNGHSLQKNILIMTTEKVKSFDEYMQ
jgi:hypothetical protein